MPRFRTLRREGLQAKAVTEGAGKPDCVARHVGIGLNSRCNSGRPVAELGGAWCLKPYWGKPTVRNFREGGWKRDYGSRTEAQRESLGIATERYRARAPVLYPTGTQPRGTTRKLPCAGPRAGPNASLADCSACVKLPAGTARLGSLPCCTM